MRRVSGFSEWVKREAAPEPRCHFNLPFRFPQARLPDRACTTLIFRNHQHVFLRFIYAAVVLVEMEDVGGEEGGFPANVGEGFLHLLLN